MHGATVGSRGDVEDIMWVQLEGRGIGQRRFVGGRGLDVGRQRSSQLFICVYISCSNCPGRYALSHGATVTACRL